MFEKSKLKKRCGSKIKKVFYSGIELWVPEDFYDRPVDRGSVLFHLESVMRGYWLHAIAGSRATISANLTFDAFYNNVSTSMLKLHGTNTYQVRPKTRIEEKNKIITTESYHYEWQGYDMQIFYMWIVFEKTQQYVLLYGTGHAQMVESRYDEMMDIARTVRCV